MGESLHFCDDPVCPDPVWKPSKLCGALRVHDDMLRAVLALWGQDGGNNVVPSRKQKLRLSTVKISFRKNVNKTSFSLERLLKSV